MRAILAANGADLATFALAIGLVGLPIELESNPAMVAAYAGAGLAGVALLKLGLVAIELGLVRRIRTRSRRPARLLAYALGLAGAASNVVAIVRYG